MRHRPLPSILIAALGAAALGVLPLTGCTADLNASDDLIDAPPLPALHPEIAQGTRQNDAPSVETLDRRNWPATEVVVPTGQVEYQPTYIEEYFTDDTTARERGEYPTLETMLEGSGDEGQQALKGAMDYPASAFLLLAAPVKMIFGEVPWKTVRGPNGGYQRMPAPPDDDPWQWVTPLPDSIPMPQEPVGDELPPLPTAPTSTTPSTTSGTGS